MPVRPRKFGRGHIPDKCDPRDWPAHKLVGTSPSAPLSTAGLAAFLGYPANQGYANSCVGEAITHGLHSLLKVEGKTAIRPSSSLAWYLPRALEGTTNENVGCMPRDAFIGMTDTGYCDEHYRPRDTPCWQPPGPEVWQHAIDGRDLKYYRVISRGETRREEISRALVQLYPVCLALQVGDRYMDNHGEIWDGKESGEVGGHYVFCFAYDQTVLWHIGSYGAGFGNYGRVPVLWDAILDTDITSDIWVLTYAPEVR